MSISKYRSYRKDTVSGSATVQHSIFSSIKTSAPDTPLDNVADIIIGNKI